MVLTIVAPFIFSSDRGYEGTKPVCRNDRIGPRLLNLEKLLTIMFAVRRRCLVGSVGLGRSLFSTHAPLFQKVEPPKPSGSKILDRIPRFLHPWTKQFINAPLSHVTAFLILHEITAIVPLVGIWYLFHHYNWMIPMDLPHWAIQKGTAVIDKSMARFDFGDYSLQEKARFIMEGAYSYVIVKSLFPVRLFFSLTMMPFFAKYFVVPFTRIFKRKKAQPPQTVEPELKPKKLTKPRL